MKEILTKIKDGVVTTIFYVTLTAMALVLYGMQFVAYQKAAQAELESKQKADITVVESAEEREETEDSFETER